MFKRQIVTDYHQVFGTEQGKRVLADMCKCAHVYSQLFDENPYTTAFKEGERAMVLRILRALKMNPSDVERLMEEQEEEEDDIT